MNPSGYQWFDLSKDDNNYITKEALKSEHKINQFLNEIKNEYSLDSKNISLSGFSQGCMIGLNVALKLEEKINCLVPKNYQDKNRQSTYQRQLIRTYCPMVRRRLLAVNGR